MTQDPLAPYRKTTPAPAGGLASGEAGEYKAFGTKDKLHRLRIRRSKGLTHSPGYHLLLDICYDGQHGTEFVLVYTIMMVMVEGKNLQQLIFAIENGMADFIQEFDANRWAKPGDGQAAFIESIEIKLLDNPDGEKSGNGRH